MTASFPSEELIRRHAPLRCSDGIAIHQTADIYALWRAWEEEAGHECPVPYWAVIWPAAHVLLRYVLDDPSLVKGRTVLDLGCGGGAVAIAAARAGAAKVIANDIDPVCLFMTGRNAEASGVELQLDSRDLTIGPGATGWYDLVFVADLFYEKSPSERLLDFLHQHRAAGAEVLVADGGRPFAGAGLGKEALREETVAVDNDLEGVRERTVRLLRLG
jgi:predicted nicotinamide N-methyase